MCLCICVGAVGRGGVGTEYFQGSVAGAGGVGVCSRVLSAGSQCYVELVNAGLGLPVAGSGFGFDCDEVDDVLWSNASNAVDASGQLVGGGDPLLGPVRGRRSACALFV
jgi:hypothetical protein